MSGSEATFAGAGGLEIFWRSWPAGGAPRAVVVIVHGAGEHSGRYEWVAAQLAARSCAVYALDHRGHGRSAGHRGLIDRLDNAVADVDRLVTIARDAHPDLPLFLLGHSMGGTVSLRYAIAHQDRLAGVILSGPLAALQNAPAWLRMAGRALSVLAPRMGLIAVDPALVSRDPDVVAAYRSDPLILHGKLPVRTVAELAAAVEGFPSTVAAITVPTLILYGTADRICPPAGSIMLGERIGAVDRSVRAYDGLFHEILNEPERGAVMRDICAWLAERAVTIGSR